VVAPDAAVSLLAAKGRPWEADLYRLAANRRAADLTPGDAGSAWYSHRGTQPFERHREQLIHPVAGYSAIA
jgi:hypothetical protein